MDRDQRWERIQKAFEGIVGGVGQKLEDPDKLKAAVQESYDAGRNDEFIEPIIVNPEGLVKEGDAVVFIDFRADRMRQIVQVMGGVGEIPFQSEVGLPKDLLVCQMTRYGG